MGCDAGKALKTVGSFIPGVGQVIGAIDAKEAADENRKRIKNESQESQRRMAAQAAQRAGTARARLGASGVRASGSMMDYIGAMEEEDERQLSFLNKAGKSQAKIAKKQGESAFYQGLGQAGQAAAGWWG